MNLHTLRIFVEVADLGSVTRAAERLHLTQPAVTIQVKKLEREVGMKLLVSEGRTIKLTDNGSALHLYAKPLFALERQIDQRVEELRTGTIGTLRLVSTFLIANVLLPEWLAHYKMAHENVEVILSTSNTQEAYNQLHHYEAEIAFVGGGWEEQGIRSEVLFEDEHWFIAPTSHRLAFQEVTLEELAKEPFIMREKGSATREKLEAICKAYNINPPKIGLQFNGLNETIRAVIAGYGVNFVPKLAVQGYVEQGDVCRIQVKHIDMKRYIAVCTRDNGLLSPAANDFIQYVKSRYTKA